MTPLLLTWTATLLGISMPVMGQQPADCGALVAAVLGEVSAGHWDPAVRAKAANMEGAARQLCADEGSPEGAVARLLARFDDPAVRLLSASHFERMAEEWSGVAIDGVGLTEVLSIDADEGTGRLTVITPVPGSAAAAAGLRSGDVVTHIEGAATDTLGLTRAMERLRAPRGDTVRLEVLRNGSAKRVVLRSTHLPAVDALQVEQVERAGGRFLILRLRQFVPGVAEELRLALESARAADGLVLDLRNNPGGYVEPLLSAAGAFLEASSEVGRLSGPEPAVLSTETEPTTRLPLAVLVGPGTASAAEALAGALQAHGRAKVYGQPTYGKGLVHAARPLEEGAWILMLPTARLRTPHGRDLLTEGIAPDVRTSTPLSAAIEALSGETG